MVALPNKESFTGSNVSQGSFKDALDDLRDYLAGVLGTDGTAATARQQLGLTAAATSSISAINYQLIPQGTRMVFHQATAPAGWTQDTSVNDRVLRVVSGSGGGVGGDWKITGLSASVNVHGHTLTIAQIPPHDHYEGGNHEPGHGRTSYKGVTGTRSTGAESRYIAAYKTEMTGGGEAHSHGASATVSQNGNWRPAYSDVIVASKA